MLHHIEPYHFSGISGSSGAGRTSDKPPVMVKFIADLFKGLGSNTSLVVEVAVKGCLTLERFAATMLLHYRVSTAALQQAT